jgi:ribosomal protein S18 acetylase RimI-like enzyme
MNNKLIIKNYNDNDKYQVIRLWNECGLIIQDNDPEKDIELKLKFQPELFFVALLDENIIGSVMVGYDGHRGWLNYLGVHPSYRGNGCGRSLVEFSIQKLKELNCPKLNLQIRNNNSRVTGFYQKLGFKNHEVNSMQLKL